MLTCREMSRLISDGLDRPLSWPNRLRLGLHLLGCRPCQRFRRAVRWLHQSLPAAHSAARLSARARRRIQRALQEKRGEN